LSGAEEEMVVQWESTSVIYRLYEST